MSFRSLAAYRSARDETYIRKMTVAVVAIQAVRVFFRCLLHGGEVGTVREEDVGSAVAVIVEDRNTAGHGFRCVSSARSFVAIQPKGKTFQLKLD